MFGGRSEHRRRWDMDGALLSVVLLNRRRRRQQSRLEVVVVEAIQLSRSITRTWCE